MTRTKPIKASLYFTRMSAMAVKVRALAVYTGLKDNLAYSDIPFDLSDFKMKIDALETSITASMDGGKMAIEQRKHDVAIVIKALHQLGHYVEAKAENDINTFRSSGFEPIIRSRTMNPPISNGFKKI